MSIHTYNPRKKKLTIHVGNLHHQQNLNVNYIIF